MTRVKTWTVVIEQEGEDLILPLSQDMLDEVGWLPGDTIEWHDRGDGTWEIRKKLEQSGNEGS
jgi:hypothetical protein